jgi:hypothetical protein
MKRMDRILGESGFYPEESLLFRHSASDVQRDGSGRGHAC